jgi:hypothetical protein
MVTMAEAGPLEEPGRRDVRRRQRRAALWVALAVVLGVTVAFVALAPSVGPGSVWGGRDPRLLAITAPESGSPGIYIYGYAPGAEIRFLVSVRNMGLVPVTVLGLGRVSSPMVASAALLLPPGGSTPDELALEPSAAGAPWYSEPFTAFPLAPGESATAALAMRLVDCASLTALPTLASGTPLGSEPPSGSGSTALTSIPVRYSSLGIEREALLAATIDLAVADGSVPCQP